MPLRHGGTTASGQESRHAQPLSDPSSTGRRNDRFCEEIRELLYSRSGKRIHKRRLLFAIARMPSISLCPHAARDELQPNPRHSPSFPPEPRRDASKSMNKY